MFENNVGNIRTEYVLSIHNDNYNTNTILIGQLMTNLKNVISLDTPSPQAVTSWTSMLTGVGSNAMPAQNTFNGVVYGSRYVAVGSGTNTIAYSTDGISWTGVGTSIFSTSGLGVTWNGARFVATGSGTNVLAYSSDGISWTPGYVFNVDDANGVVYGGSKYVAVGKGTGNTISYSSDGVSWSAVSGSTSLFSTSGSDVAYSSELSRFVAVGSGTNTIVYSDDGVTWYPVANSTSIFSTSGNGITWNGSRFIATGTGTNTIAYSTDGLRWFTGYSTSTSLADSAFTEATSVESNTNIGALVVDSQMIVSDDNNNTLDVVIDPIRLRR
jgi:hypothetical protein